MTDATLARAAPQSGSASVKVWDPFVRIFHWSLVSLFIAAFVTADHFETLHMAAGYALAGLVAARIVWGFIGPPHARFRSFMFAPGTILTFLRDTMRLRAPRHLGHNPAGGLMVLALIAMMLVIAATGHLQTLDAFAEAEWIEDLHEGAVFATLGLIALHLVGVFVASVEHRENLVAAMFTGRKRPLSPTEG